MPALRRIARLSIWKFENDALPGAVDRLADAIAEPLLDKKYAERERNASER
ncbi:protease III [Escherichia coli]|uniref:Protease III n=1 Tax=Escherichia coli TaxID=562 RepID=A0A376TSW6_ECOLX|nr:protease III [Escherichia coli]